MTMTNQHTDAFGARIEEGDHVTRWRREHNGGTVLVLCHVVGFTSTGLSVRVREIAAVQHRNAAYEAPVRGGIFAVPREQVAKYGGDEWIRGSL